MISTRMIFQRLCRKLGWRALLTVLSALPIALHAALAGVTRGDVDIAVANLASTPKRADLMLLSQAYLRGPSMWIGRGTTEQSHNLRVATPADIRWEFVQAHKGERHWTPVPVKSWSEVDAALETLNLNGKLDALMASHLPFFIS